MNTRCAPEELAEAMMLRSVCSVQVGACLVDAHGAYSWGWNGSGPTGMGEHAEVHCLKRANFHRQPGSTLYVASQRQRNAKAITSKPCDRCQGWIEARGIAKVYWRGGDLKWHLL